MAIEHFFVRHGDYEHIYLTAEGHEQSERAADELAAKELGEQVLLLSSSRERALETAEHISNRLGIPVLASSRLNIAGNYPRVVEDLDDFLWDVAHETGADYAEDTQIVAVAHAPLLAAILGRDPYDTHGIEYGQVVPYRPGSWNPGYFSQREFDRRFPAI